MSLPGRFLHVAGQRVFHHRRSRSGGRPLVLLHGYGLSHWAWRHVIPRLADEHDVIAIDLLGFGESDRPPVHEFRYDAAAQTEAVLGVLDALGIERAHLMGHSMGAAIALHTAARRPERVDRLIAVGSIAYPFRVPLETRAALLPYVGTFIMKTFYTKGLLTRYLRKQVYQDPRFVTEDWVDYIWERMNRPGGFEAAHAALRFITHASAVARCVRAVRAPTLIVWGERDRVLPLAHGQRLVGEVAGAELAVIPSCGHSPAEEKPDELLAAVLPFLHPAAARASRAGIAAVSS